jgi:hypothetical protein
MNIVRMQNRLVRFRSGRNRPGASAVRCNPSFSSRFAVLRSGHLLVDPPCRANITPSDNPTYRAQRDRAQLLFPEPSSSCQGAESGTEILRFRHMQS